MIQQVVLEGVCCAVFSSSFVSIARNIAAEFLSLFCKLTAQREGLFRGIKGDKSNPEEFVFVKL